MAFSKLTEWMTPKKKRIYDFTDGCAEDRQFLGYKGAILAEMTRIKVPVPYGFVISAECSTEFLAHHPGDSEYNFTLTPDETQKRETTASASASSSTDKKPFEVVRAGTVSVEQSGLFSKPFKTELTKYVHQLERNTGRIFSGGSGNGSGSGKSSAKEGASSAVQVSNPLLLSVRVSCNAHVDGLMESVLNIGLNESLVHSLAAYTGSPRFAYDTYRRFLQLYAVHINGADPCLFSAVVERIMSERNITQEGALTTFDFQQMVTEFKKISAVPEDPWEQLYSCIAAIYRSWDLPSVSRFRDIHSIPWSMGTAVVVQSMVYGNRDEHSGSGVLCTRNPCTGQKEVTGEYLPSAEGDEVTDGSHRVLTLEKLKDRSNTPDSAFAGSTIHENLVYYATKLEAHFRDMQDIEFTVQNGVVFVLECSAAKRSAKAAVKVCVDMARENLITEREALLRMEAKKISFFERNNMLEPLAAASACMIRTGGGPGADTTTQLVAKGASVAVGAACGKIVFNALQLDSVKAAGDRAILVKVDRIDDVDVDACDGLLLVNSSMHSNAAHSARAYGSPAVNLADVPGTLGVKLEGGPINEKLRISSSSEGESVLRFGDDVTLDGFTGNVFRGTVVRTTARDDEDYQTLLRWAHKYKRMHVYAGAHNMKEVELAARLEAEGLGQCRTDFMFRRPECIRLTQAVILSHRYDERCALLNKLVPMHQDMFLAILRLFPNKDVSFRLLEASMVDFLPKVFGAVFNQEGKYVHTPPKLDTVVGEPGSTSAAVNKVTQDEYNRHCHELAAVMELAPVEVHARITTAMPPTMQHLGFRGARLAVVYPELVAMQTKALIGAAIIAARESDISGGMGGISPGGLSGRLEISIPTVASDHEIEQIAPVIKKAAELVMHEEDYAVPYHLAASLEVPRACMRADAIAQEYNTSSVTIDTDSLTHLMYGCDRHDCAKFLPTYKRLHIFPSDPFQTLDQRGVGSIMEIAVSKVHGSAADRSGTGLAGLFQSSSPADSAKKRDRGEVKVGVCGLHCSDPASVAFFSGQLKVDFMAVPVASVNVSLILAAKAAIKESAEAEAAAAEIERELWAEVRS